METKLKNSSSITTKQIFLIGFLGNVAEWYDFSIYAYFATQIGQDFFNVQSEVVALIQAFFVFSMSYLARPFGSIFFGYLGDKLGRKVVLNNSLLIMAIPTLLIGLLPTYNTLGVIAPCLLIALRLIQGFAAGGELPISACYLYEISPEHKKNFFCSFIFASSMFGVLLASFVAMLTTTIFPQDITQNWGWRIPFFLGFVMFFFIIWVRKNVVETLNCTSNKKQQSRLKNLLNHKMAILHIICLYAFIQTTFYLIFVWMPSYLQVFLNVDKKIGLVSNSIGLTVLIIFTLFFGFIADYIKPRRLIIFSLLSIAILAYPLFYLLISRDPFSIIMAQMAFAICLGAIDGVMIPIMGRIFMSNVRCLGIGLSSTLASAIFGGLAPTVCSYLIKQTNYMMWPATLLVLVGVVALPSAFKIAQTPNQNHKQLYDNDLVGV